MTTQIYCIGEHPGAANSNVSIPKIEPRGSLTAKFDRLMVELEARNAEIEQFVRTVSHDLKSPLITIKGFLALLKRDAATGDRDLLADDIRQIGRAADRLLQLLDDLFEYHRIAHRGNSPESVPLGALAKQALDLVLHRLDDRGLEVVIAPDLPVVTGDAARLLQVFQQLFANAVRFMGDQASPRIEVGVRSDGGETICYVRDNGVGIEPRDHERIFRMFKRLPPQKIDPTARLSGPTPPSLESVAHRNRLQAGTGGTGAGLALVKRIVEIHGGRIWVESEGKGTGSTFCFTAPEATPCPKTT